MQSVVAYCILLQVACYDSTGKSDANDSVGIETAISIVQAQQDNYASKIRVAKWIGTGVSGKIGVDGSGIVVDQKEDGLHQKTSVIFNPSKKKYFYRTTGIFVWKNGQADHLGSDTIITGDGEARRHYVRSKAGKELPGNDVIGEGEIKKEKWDDFIEEYGVRTGIGFFPPYFLNRRFSDLLRKKHKDGEIYSIENKSGLWVIEMSRFDADVKGRSFRIIYDPAKGAIEKAQWITAKEGRLWREIVVERAEVLPKIWLPSKVTISNYLDKNRSEFIFDDLAVNEDIDDVVFSQKFPPGTNVYDQIENHTYSISAGLGQDHASIVNFMNLNELRSGSGPFGWRMSDYFISAGILFGICLAAMLYFIIRRNKKVLLVVLSCCCVHSVAFGVDPDSTGNWVLKSPGRDPQFITQCGLNVAIASLEFFRVPYSPKIVSLSLPIEKEGIRFSSIKHILEAYGLEVVARDGVKFEDFTAVLREDLLAIFPVKVRRGINHYLIATKSKGKKVVIDVPLQVKDLTETISSEMFEELGGTVLFVSKTKKKLPAQADQVLMSPDKIELGIFGPKIAGFSSIQKRKIVVENKGGLAVGIEKFISPCGCISVDGTSVTIAPSSSVDLPVKVILGGWKKGVVQREIGVVFLDGSRKDIIINGQLDHGQDERSVGPEESSVEFTVDDEGDKKSFRKIVAINHPGFSYDSISFHSEISWVKPVLVKSEEFRSFIILELVSDKLSNDNLRESGVVKIGVTGSPINYPIEIVASKRSWFSVSSQIFDLKAGKHNEIRITPDGSSEKIIVKKIYLKKDSRELAIKTVERKSNDVVLVFDLPEDVKSGYDSICGALEINSKIRRFEFPVNIRR